MRKQILILGHDDGTPFVDVYNQYVSVFNRTEFEVTVAYLTIGESQRTREQTLAEHVIFLNIPKKRVRGLKLRAIYQLWRLTVQKKFDIVICHRYKPSYIMLWVAKLTHLPHLICVMHELRTMQAKGRQLLVRLLASSNVTLAGVSNAVRDDMRRDLLLPASQVQTLYNVIDVAATEQQLVAPAAARTILKLPANNFLFCNLARLAINKDQQTLIRAFATVKPQMPTAKLVMMGEGSLRSVLQQQVLSEATLETDDVIFTGFVAQGWSYLRGFDCFVLSSTQEAFGRVILEAMVAKLPIIVTEVHGIPEVVGNVGTKVRAKDDSAFATAMLTAYLQSVAERELSGSAGYQRVQAHYSLTAFAKQFWALPTFVAHENA